jgi:nucleoside-diphosphate-sugar epimerase
MENITLGEILMLAERITGIRAPRFKVPKPIVKGAAILLDLIGRIVRKDILLNRQSARVLYTTHPVFDSSKAQKELNWKPAPFDKSFSEVIKWYQEKYERRKT